MFPSMHILLLHGRTRNKITHEWFVFCWVGGLFFPSYGRNVGSKALLEPCFRYWCLKVKECFLIVIKSFSELKHQFIVSKPLLVIYLPFLGWRWQCLEEVLATSFFPCALLFVCAIKENNCLYMVYGNRHII